MEFVHIVAGPVTVGAGVVPLLATVMANVIAALVPQALTAATDTVYEQSCHQVMSWVVGEPVMVVPPLPTKPVQVSVGHPPPTSVMVHEYEVASLTALTVYGYVAEEAEEAQGAVLPESVVGAAGALLQGQKTTCQQLQLE